MSSLALADGVGPPGQRRTPFLPATFLRALTGQELDGVKLEAELLFPACIRQALNNWRVGTPMTICDREVPVQGDTAGATTATFCFEQHRR